jgi:ribose transport system permease protein
MTEQVIEGQRAERRTGATLGKILTAMGPLVVLFVLIALLWLTTPAFRRPSALLLIGLEAAAIGVVAAGQTFVILTGGIDLSVEAMVSFSGVVAAILIAGTNVAQGQIAFGISPVLAVLIALAVGTGVGLFQGVIITAFNMNPFIVTLGFRSILLGVSLVVTNGAGINIQKDGFLNTITGLIPISEGVGVPVPLIIAVIIFGIAWVVLRRTKLGRYTYAIGGNETAARLSGINVNVVKILIYGISGLLASIGGILVMGRLQSGAYQNGTDMTLKSVAAVVIGGTALAGGTGGIWGTLVGVFIIRVVEAGLVYVRVPSTTKEIVIGVIIVVAVALDVWRRGEIKWIRFGRRRAAV